MISHACHTQAAKMKVILALAMLFAPAAAHMKYFSNNTENNIYAFNAFKSDFHKTYVRTQTPPAAPGGTKKKKS